MDRREMLTLTGMGATGFVFGSGFTAPACDGVSKDKAVRYTDLTINYLKDILPLASEAGSSEIVDLINKGIPQLEKLKSALEKVDVPVAKNLFDTVTSTVGQINNALSRLPESARRDAIMATLTIVNISLRSVQLFVEAAQATGDGPRRAPGPRHISPSAEAIWKAFEATRY